MVSNPINAVPIHKYERPRRPNGAGSIQKLGARGGAKSRNPSSCKWRAQYTDYLSPRIPKPRPSKQFKTYREAERWLNERITEQERGFCRTSIDSKMTVEEFIKNFITNREEKGRASETIRNYKSNIKNQISPRIGHLNATRISPHAIDSMFSAMTQEGLHRAAELSFVLLNAAYKYAVKMGELAFNPMQRIERPKYICEPSPAIDLDDLSKIYQTATSSPYMHARIETAVVLGLRPCEALGLCWSDFNLDSESPRLTVTRKLQRVKGEGLVFGPTKTRKTLVKQLSNEQVKIFKMHKATQGLQKANWISDYDLVFPSPRGLPKDDKADYKDWKRLLEQAGVKNYQRYQSRKSAFTYINAGVDYSTLMKYSGHSQLSTLLKHYIFPVDSSMKKLLAEQDSFRESMTHSK